MVRNFNILVVCLLAVLAEQASAFWRLPCEAPIVVQRADPVVTPGKVAPHAHTIMGGSGFGFEMTYTDTQKSTCSSCIVTKDFSNYWVPNLYYKAKNGSFISVGQNGGATVYYLQRADEKDPEYSSGLLAFPEGFRMLAGNPMLRNYTGTIEQQAISFACLGVSGPETNTFPAQNCPDGLRIQIFFPSCWDGVNLDSADHKSHMAYPSQYNSGFCPSTHPKRFISIFYEVIWNTPDFADMWYDGQQPFVLSNGDDTGYGYHGDFVNGWDVPTLQKAVTQCTADSGVIQDCPVFDFFTDEFSQACKIPASIDEPVQGVLAALPGCNPVQSGPDMAQAITGCGAPTTISPPEYNFVDLTVSKQFQYLGCGTDIAGQSRTLGGDSLTADDMTNEKCVDYCMSKGFSIAGTEFANQCYCDNTVPSDRAPVPGLMGNCLMPCAGDAKEMCGGGGQISLYQKCSSTCQNVVFAVNNSTSSAFISSSTSTATAMSSLVTVGYSSTTGSMTTSTTTIASTGGVYAEPSSASPASSSVVTLISTLTVIPLASTPDAPASTKDSTTNPEPATVTIALFTVTVTATTTAAAGA